MLYVNDSHYDERYFERCYAAFDRHALLRRCAEERITTCVSDAAFSLALALYIKQRGGTLFPLAPDTPLEAARRRAQRSASRYLLTGGDPETILNTIESIDESEARHEQTGALIQTSSGTTGEAKYIARSWSSIDAEIESYNRHFDASGLTPIVACPVNHSYGLISGVLAALRRGVEPVVVTNPNPRHLLRKLQEAARPLLYSSPPLLAAVTMLARADAPIFAVMTSGTLLKQSAFIGIRQKVRHLHQQYGCSEAGCVTLGEDIAQANDVGQPLPHLELTAGRTPVDPAEIIVRIGAHTIATRDLGYLERGSLRYLTRIDDMINVSGLNVYPGEVEEVVLQMPAVSDAVVFRASHDFGSDQVCLQFVADEPLQPSQIREWCARRLAGYQVPMRIAQVEVIPRLPNGKISRKTLAEDSARRDAWSAQQRASS